MSLLFDKYGPVLLSCLLMLIFGCSKGGTSSGYSSEDSVDSISVNTTPVQWKVTEIHFSSNKKYSDPFKDVNLDVVFTHSGGIKFKVPAFWNGKNNWTVRFAPTLTGVWSYVTICSDSSNSSLNNQIGKIHVQPYKEDLEIYKHGFIITKPGQRYFTYHDGTPFLYLGDTHWSMVQEPLNVFKTIIDKRVKQGFTVIQSEPISILSKRLRAHFTAEALSFFDTLDKRFNYIAQKGLIHANAELFFTSELMNNKEFYPDKYLEKLCRYWIARYAAYPVVWTTAQEADNDFYHERGDQPNFDSKTNPWKKVATYIHKYDPYKHPLTAHMENTNYTTASNSSFKYLPAHTWFAAQWSPKEDGQINFKIPEGFWNNGQGKPTVNYEGLYDHLWTLEFGARMQGWIAYLNGMYGYGYGAIDIWYYNSTYDMDEPTKKYGYIVTLKDKQVRWNESVEFPSAYQVGYIKRFFNSIDWWKLIPRFGDTTWFERSLPLADKCWYSLASDSNNTYVVYFYNRAFNNTGVLKKLQNTNYTIQWFNPKTGKWKLQKTVKISNGKYVIGNKPNHSDWVLLVKKND